MWLAVADERSRQRKRCSLQQICSKRRSSFFASAQLEARLDTVSDGASTERLGPVDDTVAQLFRLPAFRIVKLALSVYLRCRGWVGRSELRENVLPHLVEIAPHGVINHRSNGVILAELSPRRVPLGILCDHRHLWRLESLSLNQPFARFDRPLPQRCDRLFLETLSFHHRGGHRDPGLTGTYHQVRDPQGLLHTNKVFVRV